MSTTLKLPIIFANISCTSLGKVCEPLAAVMGRKRKKNTQNKVHRLVEMIDPLLDSFEFTFIHHAKMSIIYQDTAPPDADPDMSHDFELDSPEPMALTADTNPALDMTPAPDHKALSPGATPISADTSQLFLIDADGTELGHGGARPLAESTRQQESRWPRPNEAQPRSSDRLLTKALEGQLMGGLNRGDSYATPTSRLTDRQKKLDAIERVGGHKGPEILFDDEVVISKVDAHKGNQAAIAAVASIFSPVQNVVNSSSSTSSGSVVSSPSFYQETEPYFLVVLIRNLESLVHDNQTNSTCPLFPEQSHLLEPPNQKPGEWKTPFMFEEDTVIHPDLKDLLVPDSVNVLFSSIKTHKYLRDNTFNSKMFMAQVVAQAQKYDLEYNAALLFEGDVFYLLRLIWKILSAYQVSPNENNAVMRELANLEAINSRLVPFVQQMYDSAPVPNINSGNLTLEQVEEEKKVYLSELSDPSSGLEFTRKLFHIICGAAECVSLGRRFRRECSQLLEALFNSQEKICERANSFRTEHHEYITSKESNPVISNRLHVLRESCKSEVETFQMLQTKAVEAVHRLLITHPNTYNHQIILLGSFGFTIPLVTQLSQILVTKDTIEMDDMSFLVTRCLMESSAESSIQKDEVDALFRDIVNKVTESMLVFESSEDTFENVVPSSFDSPRPKLAVGNRRESGTFLNANLSRRKSFSTSGPEDVEQAKKSKKDHDTPSSDMSNTNLMETESAAGGSISTMREVQDEIDLVALPQSADKTTCTETQHKHLGNIANPSTPPHSPTTPRDETPALTTAPAPAPPAEVDKDISNTDPTSGTTNPEIEIPQLTVDPGNLVQLDVNPIIDNTDTNDEIVVEYEKKKPVPTNCRELGPLKKLNFARLRRELGLRGVNHKHIQHRAEAQRMLQEIINVEYAQEVEDEKQLNHIRQLEAEAAAREASTAAGTPPASLISNLDVNESLDITSSPTPTSSSSGGHSSRSSSISTPSNSSAALSSAGSVGNISAESAPPVLGHRPLGTGAPNLNTKNIRKTAHELLKKQTIEDGYKLKTKLDTCINKLRSKRVGLIGGFNHNTEQSALKAIFDLCEQTARHYIRLETLKNLWNREQKILMGDSRKVTEDKVLQCGHLFNNLKDTIEAITLDLDCTPNFSFPSPAMPDEEFHHALLDDKEARKVFADRLKNNLVSRNHEVNPVKCLELNHLFVQCGGNQCAWSVPIPVPEWARRFDPSDSEILETQSMNVPWGEYLSIPEIQNILFVPGLCALMMKGFMFDARTVLTKYGPGLLPFESVEKRIAYHRARSEKSHYDPIRFSRIERFIILQRRIYFGNFCSDLVFQFLENAEKDLAGGHMTKMRTKNNLPSDQLFLECLEKLDKHARIRVLDQVVLSNFSSFHDCLKQYNFKSEEEKNIFLQNISAHGYGSLVVFTDNVSVILRALEYSQQQYELFMGRNRTLIDRNRKNYRINIPYLYTHNYFWMLDSNKYLRKENLGDPTRIPGLQDTSIPPPNLTAPGEVRMVPTLTGVSMVQGSMMHVSPLLPTLLRQQSHNNTTPPVVAKIPNSIANYPPLPPMVTRPANNSIPQPTETQQNVPVNPPAPPTCIYPGLHLLMNNVVSNAPVSSTMSCTTTSAATTTRKPHDSVVTIQDLGRDDSPPAGKTNTLNVGGSSSTLLQNALQKRQEPSLTLRLQPPPAASLPPPANFQHNMMNPPPLQSSRSSGVPQDTPVVPQPMSQSPYNEVHKNDDVQNPAHTKNTENQRVRFENETPTHNVSMVEDTAAVAANGTVDARMLNLFLSLQYLKHTNELNIASIIEILTQNKACIIIWLKNFLSVFTMDCKRKHLLKKCILWTKRNGFKYFSFFFSKLHQNCTIKMVLRKAFQIFRGGRARTMPDFCEIFLLLMLSVSLLIPLQYNNKLKSSLCNAIHNTNIFVELKSFLLTFTKDVQKHIVFKYFLSVNLPSIFDEDSDSDSSNSVPRLGDLLFMYHLHDDGRTKRRILTKGRLIAINKSASSTSRYILVIPTFCGQSFKPTLAAKSLQALYKHPVVGAEVFNDNNTVELSLKKTEVLKLKQKLKGDVIELWAPLEADTTRKGSNTHSCNPGHSPNYNPDDDRDPGRGPTQTHSQLRDGPGGGPGHQGPASGTTQTHSQHRDSSSSGSGHNPGPTQTNNSSSHQHHTSDRNREPPPPPDEASQGWHGHGDDDDDDGEDDDWDPRRRLGGRGHPPGHRKPRDDPNHYSNIIKKRVALFNDKFLNTMPTPEMISNCNIVDTLTSYSANLGTLQNLVKKIADFTSKLEEVGDTDCLVPLITGPAASPVTQFVSSDVWTVKIETKILTLKDLSVRKIKAVEKLNFKKLDDSMKSLPKPEWPLIHKPEDLIHLFYEFEKQLHNDPELRLQLANSAPMLEQLKSLFKMEEDKALIASASTPDDLLKRIKEKYIYNGSATKHQVKSMLEKMKRQPHNHEAEFKNLNLLLIHLERIYVLKQHSFIELDSIRELEKRVFMPSSYTMYLHLFSQFKRLSEETRRVIIQDNEVMNKLHLRTNLEQLVPEGEDSGTLHERSMILDGPHSYTRQLQENTVGQGFSALRQNEEVNEPSSTMRLSFFRLIAEGTRKDLENVRQENSFRDSSTIHKAESHVTTTGEENNNINNNNECFTVSTETKKMSVGGKKGATPTLAPCPAKLDSCKGEKTNSPHKVKFGSTFHCLHYRKLSDPEKLRVAKARGLCYLCLQNHQTTSMNCQYKGKIKCRTRGCPNPGDHNPILHGCFHPPSQESAHVSEEQGEEEDGFIESLEESLDELEVEESLMAEESCNVPDGHGEFYPLRGNGESLQKLRDLVNNRIQELKDSAGENVFDNVDPSHATELSNLFYILLSAVKKEQSKYKGNNSSSLNSGTQPDQGGGPEASPGEVDISDDNTAESLVTLMSEVTSVDDSNCNVTLINRLSTLLRDFIAARNDRDITIPTTSSDLNAIEIVKSNLAFIVKSKNATRLPAYSDPLSDTICGEVEARVINEASSKRFYFDVIKSNDKSNIDQMFILYPNKSCHLYKSMIYVMDRINKLVKTQKRLGVFHCNFLIGKGVSADRIQTIKDCGGEVLRNADGQYVVCLAVLCDPGASNNLGTDRLLRALAGKEQQKYLCSLSTSEGKSVPRLTKKYKLSLFSDGSEYPFTASTVPQVTVWRALSAPEKLILKNCLHTSTLGFLDYAQKDTPVHLLFGSDSKNTFPIYTIRDTSVLTKKTDLFNPNLDFIFAPRAANRKVTIRGTFGLDSSCVDYDQQFPTIIFPGEYLHEGRLVGRAGLSSIFLRLLKDDFPSSEEEGGLNLDKNISNHMTHILLQQYTNNSNNNSFQLESFINQQEASDFGKFLFSEGVLAAVSTTGGALCSAHKHLETRLKSNCTDCISLNEDEILRKDRLRYKHLFDNLKASPDPKKPGCFILTQHHMFDVSAQELGSLKSSNLVSALASSRRMLNKLRRLGFVELIHAQILARIESGEFREYTAAEYKDAATGKMYSQTVLRNFVSNLNSKSSPLRMVSNTSHTIKSIQSTLCKASFAPKIDLANYLHIYYRFLYCPIGFAGDLKGAYLSIRLSEQDSKLLSTVWFRNPMVHGDKYPVLLSQESLDFGHGNASTILRCSLRRFVAPACATKAGREVILNSCYVDNLCNTRNATVAEIAESFMDIYKAMQKFNFLLDKLYCTWDTYNDPAMKDLIELGKYKKQTDCQMFGFSWILSTDEILMSPKICFAGSSRGVPMGGFLDSLDLKSLIFTRLNVLRATSSFYCPSGRILGPVIFSAKYLLHRVCKVVPVTKMNSDIRDFDSELYELLLGFYQCVQNNPIPAMPRNLRCASEYVEHIVVSGDGSVSGVGAVIYFIFRDHNTKQLRTSVMGSKSEICDSSAPNNEVRAHYLSACLAVMTLEALGTEIRREQKVLPNVYFLSDNNASCQIQNPTRNYKGLYNNLRASSLSLYQRICTNLLPGITIKCCWISGDCNASADSVSKFHINSPQFSTQDFWLKGHPVFKHLKLLTHFCYLIFNSTHFQYIGLPHFTPDTRRTFSEVVKAFGDRQIESIKLQYSGHDPVTSAQVDEISSARSQKYDESAEEIAPGVQYKVENYLPSEECNYVDMMSVPVQNFSLLSKEKDKKLRDQIYDDIQLSLDLEEVGAGEEQDEQADVFIAQELYDIAALDTSEDHTYGTGSADLCKTSTVLSYVNNCYEYMSILRKHKNFKDKQLHHLGPLFATLTVTRSNVEDQNTQNAISSNPDIDPSNSLDKLDKNWYLYMLKHYGFLTIINCAIIISLLDIGATKLYHTPDKMKCQCRLCTRTASSRWYQLLRRNSVEEHKPQITKDTELSAWLRLLFLDQSIFPPSAPKVANTVVTISGILCSKSSDFTHYLPILSQDSPLLKSLIHFYHERKPLQPPSSEHCTALHLSRTVVASQLQSGFFGIFTYNAQKVIRSVLLRCPGCLRVQLRKYLVQPGQRYSLMKPDIQVLTHVSLDPFGPVRFRSTRRVTSSCYILTVVCINTGVSCCTLIPNTSAVSVITGLRQVEANNNVTIKLCQVDAAQSLSQKNLGKLGNVTVCQQPTAAHHRVLVESRQRILREVFNIYFRKSRDESKSILVGSIYDLLFLASAATLHLNLLPYSKYSDFSPAHLKYQKAFHYTLNEGDIKNPRHLKDPVEKHRQFLDELKAKRHEILAERFKIYRQQAKGAVVDSLDVDDVVLCLRGSDKSRDISFGKVVKQVSPFTYRVQTRNRKIIPFAIQNLRLLAKNNNDLYSAIMDYEEHKTVATQPKNAVPLDEPRQIITRSKSKLSK